MIGRIEVPGAGIRENFIAYYDAGSQRSRIDYNNGKTKTVQRENMHRIVYWMRSKITDVNEEYCEEIETDYYEPQSVFPDTSGFMLGSDPDEAKYHRYERMTEANGETFFEIFSIESRAPRYSVSKTHRVRHIPKWTRRLLSPDIHRAFRKGNERQGGSVGQ